MSTIEKKTFRIQYLNVHAKPNFQLYYGYVISRISEAKIALLIHILLGDNKINEIMKKLKNKQVSIAHSFAGNELRKAG
jgi:hypothetical protein